MNALTVADALATKYLAANITAPVGYTAIRSSTARLPNAIPSSPWVLVTLPKGGAVLGTQWIDYALEFHVLFHYAKSTGDLARDMTGMLSWLGVLLTATYADMNLGVSTIRKAYPTEFEMIVATYAGEEFYGWDITVVVDLGEAQAMAA